MSTTLMYDCDFIIDRTFPTEPGIEEVHVLMYRLAGGDQLYQMLSQARAAVEQKSLEIVLRQLCVDWHDAGPEQVAEQLRKAGYVIVKKT